MIPSDMAAAVDRVMSSAVSPGATLTGRQRRALALAARRAAAVGASPTEDSSDIGAGPTGTADGLHLDSLHREGLDPDGLHPGLVRFVGRMATEAHTLRHHDIDRLTAGGVPVANVVETLGLVARLLAVDTLHIALGLDRPELPATSQAQDPDGMTTDDVPTGQVAADARIDGAWVPTVGPASPPNALSLVPAEHRAMHDLHGALYLSIPDMADLDADRGLHRTQMELVAARTSWLNECFF